MTIQPANHTDPLNQEERDAYEGLSLNLYQGFFECQYQKAQPEQVKLHTPEQHCSHDESADDLPTDNDLEELLKDVSREESELNKVFENTNPVLNNISLSEGIVYTQANLTEMQELQDSCNQVNCTASSVVSSSQAASLFNDTDAQTRERWQDADMVHTDLFQPPNYVYVGMTNDTPQAIVSNGQIGYDHAYSSSVQAPLSPLNLARSTNGRQQQTQTSPGSATVTATATHSLFESHYMPRNSFSDCTTDSSSPCSRLSSESPRYNSESSSGQHESRFYGKLIPSRSRFDRPSPSRSPHSSKINRVMNVATRKRGRQSKDEQLAAENALPVTAHQISEMSLSELQQVLKQDDLSEYQRQLIRKIRRRGKNKVAARTCRQRRTDRHDKVSSMTHYI
ncbi:CRE-SKN-1 protein [Caenorhabditis remanei]|uniref:CRE-SKN-1 protein n=1 Tax=Caenorhabditis remanei TaxID=31234 RepID=E3MQY9_CAERE|nr:CRE-SKN-1 protein [Caenorhabditis remanei]